jgi:ATP synthase protein I
MRELDGQQEVITRAVHRFIWVQAAVVVVTSLLILFVYGVSAAVSALVGGAVGFLTSWIYAKKMIAPAGSESKQLLQAQYKAEAYKLIFTILLFSLIFTQFGDVRALPLFIGFVASLAVYWVALIFM